MTKETVEQSADNEGVLNSENAQKQKKNKYREWEEHCTYTACEMGL